MIQVLNDVLMFFKHDLKNINVHETSMWQLGIF